MNGRRILHSLTGGGRGREMRAWPLLALLILVLFVGIGCVLWFMREAMANERAAVQQRLADAYRGHLQLVQARVEALFLNQLSSLDSVEPTPEAFARRVVGGDVESIILLTPDGDVLYPTLASTRLWDGGATSSPAQIADAEEVQAAARNLIRSGDTEAAAHLISGRFSDTDLGGVIDENGRLIGANAELMVLESTPAREHPALALIAERLKKRVNDYRSPLSSAQRRFLMREYQRLYPSDYGAFPRLHPNLHGAFPTWPAENLAARYLESAMLSPSPLILERTPLPEIWRVLSPERKVLALLSTTQLRELLKVAVAQQPLPAGVSFRLLAPYDDESSEPAALVTSSLGRHFPGWRLALTLNDRALFETTANRKVTRYLWTAILVIAAMSILAAVIARTFANQLQLTRLKNDLVATVSHELKTPLTSMRVLVDTLLETDKLHDATTKEYLQLIAQENTRLSRLIDNVLTFSRLERNKLSFDFVDTAPEDVVSDAVAAMGDRLRVPGCHFETHIAPVLPLIQADRDALTTALLNLLDNAWKYSGDDKQITLRAEARNDSVSFTVQDNGVGVARRDTRKIFRRFYQVDHRLSRGTGGCGLGLSIVEQIVTAHSGEVHIKSEPGKGSSFTIEIPATRSSSPA